MAVEVTVFLALEVAVSVLSLVIGGVVLAVAPRRTINRLLAFYLLILAANFGVDVLSSVMSAARPKYNLSLYFWAVNFATPLAYLMFVGMAVDSPLSRPLRHPVMRYVLGVAIVAIFVGIFVFHAVFLQRVTVGSSTHLMPPRWVVNALLTLWVGGFLFGFIAALHAVFRAPRGTPSRRRATAYALAFGTQDLAFSAIMALGLSSFTSFGVYYSYTIPVLVVAAMLLLVRALLREQLFDFELKVKWTIKQSTIAAIFVAVFFIVSEGAQQIFQESVGPYAGIVAAGLLVFAISPLQRIAERISDAAMPNVQPTPTYVQFKKLEVYRAAVESALETGGIDERERAVLNRLREKLDIVSEDARALELECSDIDAPSAS